MVVGADLAQVIAQGRPAGYTNPIQKYSDLKPKTYSSFHKVRSHVLGGKAPRGKRGPPGRSFGSLKDLKEGSRSPSKCPTKSPGKARVGKASRRLATMDSPDREMEGSFSKSKDEPTRNIKTLSNFYSSSKSLLNEVGNFHSKQIFNKYLQAKQNSDIRLKL